ncbi:MAG: hypothetical protein KatS3mg031_0294 [Chitinophagales bacterium]|nr:MAG: hypothetical protein KatS3mg031_0294 [Chitinophagales bacterium]
MNYVTGWCVIKNQTVVKNGKVMASLPDYTEHYLIGLYEALRINYPKFYKMDNLCRLGFLAAEVLLEGSELLSRYTSEQTGVILSNKHACLDTDFHYHQTMPDAPSPSVFVYTLPNIVIGEISIRHKLKGENAFFISGQFDADFMHNYVELLLNNKILDCCLCGWIDLLQHAHEAFLYLVEKSPGGTALPHQIESIKHLKQYGTIDAGSESPDYRTT